MLTEKFNHHQCFSGPQTSSTSHELDLTSRPIETLEGVDQWELGGCGRAAHSDTLRESARVEEAEEQQTDCTRENKGMSNSPLPIRSTRNYGSCGPSTGPPANCCCTSDGYSAQVNPHNPLATTTTAATTTTTTQPDPANGSPEGGGPSSEEQTRAAGGSANAFIQRLASRVPCLGILLALCASLFLGSAGMLVKLTTSIGGIQVAVFRSIIQLVVYGSLIHFRGQPIRPARGEYKAVAVRAILGGTSMTISYYALRLIPLGDATTIRFSLPIWTLIVSYFVLNESCSLLKIGAVFMSVSGVAIIAKPDECVYFMHIILHSLSMESEQVFAREREEYMMSAKQHLMPIGLSSTQEPYRQLEGSLLALCSSICLALSLIALRMSKRTQAETIIFWLSLVSICIGMVVLIFQNELGFPTNWTDLLYVLLNGLFGAIGQWFITMALKVEQSSVISLARTFDIEVAFLYSAFLLHEPIRATSILGSVLVSTGVVAVVLPKWLSSRSGEPDKSLN